MLDIQHYTIPKAGKEKNGDAYIIKHFEKEQLLLFAVADGVSQQPCDWFASDKTCEYLVDFFSKLETEADIASRLKKSIQEVNEAIISVTGACKKMASTLSVAVWDMPNERLFYANIGDSRIYSLISDVFVQLTKDDSMIIKERTFANGTSKLIGKPILNKVIGQPDINIHVEEKKLLKQEILILATDGFYEARKATFEKAMVAFSDASNFEAHFKKTISRFEMFRDDDFTVVMLKRT